MDNAAFSRAVRFLNYVPVAKWLSIVCGVATAVLFVALLLVLALFADLMVTRGEVLALHNLALREKNQFLESISPAADAAARKTQIEGYQRQLAELGLDNTPWMGWIAEAPENVRDAELRGHLLWFAHLPDVIKESVNGAAAEEVRSEIKRNIQTLGVEPAIQLNLEDLGILGLVARSPGGLRGWLVALLARWNHWMWLDGNTAYLQGLFLLALAIAVLRLVLLFLANYMAAVATIEAITRLRKAVYQQTYRLGTLAFRALGPSEAVSVSTRHLEAVHTGLYAWLTVYFREPVKFGLLLLFAILVNFWLALAFLLFALLVWVVGGQIAAYFRRRGRAAEHEAADQLALIQESLMLMRLVKVYLMELFNQARFEKQIARYGQAQRERYRGEAIYRPVFAFLGLLAALILLLLGGFVILKGYLGVASAIIMVTALVSLYWPMATWLDNRRLFRRSRDSARVLFGFLDRTGSVGQGVEAEFLPALHQMLEFDNVTFREPGTDRKLLRGVSLTIQAGQRVALVGPDDMEKHALVYLLPRFLDPSSGEIRIDRKNLRWVTLDSLRAQIAVVLQHNLVFNDTVANNIGCGDKTYTLAKIIEAAKLAHAHQFIQKLPQGYETVIGEMGLPLQSGEMFRIALARAILRDPAIVVIEEPYQPLDEATKAIVDDTFARFLSGRTVIFLPHRLSTIRGCDCVYLLHQGKIVGSGDHRELLTTSELYRHLQYLEFNEFASLTTGPAPVQVEQDL
jgi:ATP-binding cassette subfamily B protein